MNSVSHIPYSIVDCTYLDVDVEMDFWKNFRIRILYVWAHASPFQLQNKISDFNSMPQFLDVNIFIFYAPETNLTWALKFHISYSGKGIMLHNKPPDPPRSAVSMYE